MELKLLICPNEKDVKEYAEEMMVKRKKKGDNPYYIPVGGSNYIGELGYVECMREIIEYDKDNSIYSYFFSYWKWRYTFWCSCWQNTYYKSNT